MTFLIGLLLGISIGFFTAALFVAQKIRNYEDTVKRQRELLDDRKFRGVIR